MSKETFQTKLNNLIKDASKTIMDYATMDESKIVDFKGVKKCNEPSELVHKAFMLPKELHFEDQPDISWCKFVAIKMDYEDDYGCFIDEEGRIQSFSSTVPYYLMEIADNLKNH